MDCFRDRKTRGDSKKAQAVRELGGNLILFAEMAAAPEKK